MAGELDPGQEGLDELGDLGGDDDADEGDELDTDAGDDDGVDANPPADTPAPTAEDYAKLKRKAQRQEDRITRLLKAQGKTVKRDAAGNVEDDDGKEPAAPAADPDRRVKRQAGIAALTDAGMPRAAAKTAIKLLDLSGLEVDEDGEVDEDELDELVEGLREQFPAMFERAAAGPSTRKPIPKVRTAPTRVGAPSDNPTARTSRELLRAAGFSVGRGK